MSDIKNQVQSIVKSLESNDDNFCHDCHDEIKPVSIDDTECCPYCKSDNIGQMSGFDYLEDALDIEWILSSDKTLLGARVLVCFGGPTVWIDTRNNRVDGAWWGESYSESYEDNIGLSEALDELYNC